MKSDFIVIICAVCVFSHGLWFRGMTPQQFYAKWKVTQPDLALICARSLTTVQRWFSKGRNAARPTPNDLRHLAMMDFLLEHRRENS